MKIGIDIGGSHIGAGIVTDNGKLIAKETIDINFFKDIFKNNNQIITDDEQELAKQRLVQIIEEEIDALLDKSNYKKEDIEKIGIAVPGYPSKSSIKNAVNLGIKEFNISSVLENKYNVVVELKNDGKCAGLAEKKYGSLADYKDAVFLCLGTGVGSAVFLNDKLLEPTRGNGFELGHLIIEKDGEKCNCGKKGCFETYASMKRFKKKAIYELELDEDTDSEEIQRIIRNNIDSIKVKKIVDEYLENVAIGISNIINIFEPEAICFGGSFAYYGDIFIPILQDKLKSYLFNEELEYKLIPAKLRNDAGIIGATLI